MKARRGDDSGCADGRGKDEVKVSRLRSIKSAVMSEESPYPALSTGGVQSPRRARS